MLHWLGLIFLFHVLFGITVVCCQRTQVVAVKQLDRNGLQGNREFLVEVLMLSLLHHQNLVNLIGYCADGDQRLLVYEYMPLGSLEDHLLGTSCLSVISLSFYDFIMHFGTMFNKNCGFDVHNVCKILIHKVKCGFPTEESSIGILKSFDPFIFLHRRKQDIIIMKSRKIANKKMLTPNEN